jgi:hypothetical protein
MTLEKYITKLNKLVEKHPESLNMKVVFSIDEEGNEFKPVIYDPSIGNYIDGDFKVALSKCNSVCIN